MTDQPAGTIAARNWPSLLAIGLGSALMMLAMAHHPSGQAYSGPDAVREIAAAAAFNRTVHGVLIAIMAVLTAGYAGFSATLRPRALGRFGLAAFAVGALFESVAGLINGFAVSGLMEHYAGAPAETLAALGPMKQTLWQLNQAFAGAGVIAMSLAVVLWSAALVRERGVLKLVGGAGILLGLAAIGALVGGWLELDVQGFGLFVAGQAVWGLVLALVLALTRRAN